MTLPHRPPALCPAPLALLAKAGTALALISPLMTASCALIAGLEDHELKPAEASESGLWPDSPTPFCSDGTKEIPCPADPMDPLYGQDGTAVGPIPKYQSDDSGKHVTDSVTGITWRREASVPGSQGEAVKHCDGLSSAGATYRVPTREELISLIDYGSLNEKLSGAAFPDIKQDDALWTSTDAAGQPNSGWWVGLGCVVVGSGPCMLEELNFEGPAVTGVRYNGTAGRGLCILNEKSPPPRMPLDASTGGVVIDDARTGLQWTRPTTGAGYTWSSALTYCADLALGGFEDWRLPTIKELQTVVNDTKAKPAFAWAINGGGWLWSSTPCPDFPDAAYTVLVDDGSTQVKPTTVDYYKAVCVRSGP